jgi:predicted HNH restriction endonuclease
VCGISDWLGADLILQLHHIDGNRENNKEENLTLLCPNCHT